jgi:hypothetical protein
MSDPELTGLMPALEALTEEKMRELFFFMVGWMDGNQKFGDGLRCWLSTEN